MFFFFNDPATTEIYTYLHTLSLHDALPISNLERASSVPLLGTLLAERSRHPELLAMYQERVVAPRVAKLTRILERARAQGELGPEADIPIAIQLLLGFVVGSVVTGPTFDNEAISGVVTIGRAPVRTPVTHAHLVCRLMITTHKH